MSEDSLPNLQQPPNINDKEIGKEMDPIPLENRYESLSQELDEAVNSPLSSSSLPNLEKIAPLGKGGVSEELGSSSTINTACDIGATSLTEGLLTTLLKEIKDKFAISENNQLQIQTVCETLETKMNAISERVGAMEIAFEDLTKQVDKNTYDIQALKGEDKTLK